MKKHLSLVLIGILGMATLGCEAPYVLQGTVASYQAGTKTIVIKDEIPPNPEVTLSLEGADIGAEPAPGDTVRVAYLKTDTGTRAIRLMNLSKQKELMTAGSGGH